MELVYGSMLMVGNTLVDGAMASGTAKAPCNMRMNLHTQVALLMVFGTEMENLCLQKVASSTKAAGRVV